MKLNGLYLFLLNSINAQDDEDYVAVDENDKYPRGAEHKITQVATFEISVNNEMLGEVEIGLFGDIVPKTTKNFASLCEGWTHPETKKHYSYSGSKIHRISYDFVIQGTYDSFLKSLILNF